MTPILTLTPRRRPRIARRALRATAALGFTLIAACASDPDAQEANDPLEPMNRYFFEVNRFLDQILLRPATEIYVGIMPTVVQHSITNVLDNLDEPVIAVNTLLQGDYEQAGATAVRFAMNSTIGVAGLFDVATDYGYKHRDEDFGQTLGVWGVSEGPYLMLPLLGPAPPRDLAGRAVDFAMDPWSYVWAELDVRPVTYVRMGLNLIDVRARTLGALDEIERSSIDYYAAVRSLYRQRRNAQIVNGETAVDELPSID